MSTQNQHRNVITPLALAVGAQLYISNTTLPQSELVSLGQHFDWESPRSDRPWTSRDVYQPFDVANCAILTARVPLVVAAHNPWENGEGAHNLGHMRIARTGRASITTVADNSQALFPESYWLRCSCRENGKIPHRVVDGIYSALVYEDEVVVSQYERSGDRHKHDQRLEKGVYIVTRHELDALRREYRKVGAVMSKAREGVVQAPIIRPNGAITKAALSGGYTVAYDSMGVVFGLELNGEAVGKAEFPDWALVLRVGGLIVNIRLRELLNLPALASAFDAPMPPVAAVPEVSDAGPAPVPRQVHAPAMTTPQRYGKLPSLRQLSVPAAPVEESAVVEVPPARSTALIVVSQPVESVVEVVEPAATPAPPSAEECTEQVQISDSERAEYARRQADLTVLGANEQGFPHWFAEGAKELTPLLVGKPSPGFSAEDGTMLCQAGKAMTATTVAGVIMYRDQLVCEAGDVEVFAEVRLILAALEELHQTA